MDSTTTIDIPESKAWVLVADNIASYMAQSATKVPIEVYVHDSNSVAPVLGADERAGVLQQGEAINLPGIIWARSPTGKLAQMVLFS